MCASCVRLHTGGVVIMNATDLVVAGHHDHGAKLQTFGEAEKRVLVPALLNDPDLGKSLRVFTLGNDLVSPFE